MKDPISLVAAAAGGLMLSLAAASIIHAAPVKALKSHPNIGVSHGTTLQRSLGQNKQNRYCDRNWQQNQSATPD
ncbi:MAG: hypothetical protein ACRC32_11970 [Chroococcidiopsis sp.]